MFRVGLDAASAGSHEYNYVTAAVSLSVDINITIKRYFIFHGTINRLLYISLLLIDYFISRYY